MSMTVHISTGLEEIPLLLSALKEMGIAARDATGKKSRVRGRIVEAVAHIRGDRVGFARNRQGQLEIVADQDWECVALVRSRAFRQNLAQNYSLAAVKKRVEDKGYTLESVERLEDGTLEVRARAWG